MNILILANHFNAGGISSYVLNLARGLTLRGHKVFIGSGGGDWVGRLEEYNVSHIHVPIKTKSIISPKLFLAYFVLKKVIKKERIDIIHSQTRVSSVLASWLSQKMSVPFVSTAHGFYRRRWGRKIFPLWGRLVIAISNAVKQHLIEDFRLEEDKIRLVHNGIDINKYRASPPKADPCPTAGRRAPLAEGIGCQDVRIKYGLGAGPVAGIIARLSEVKGHKYLIKAMKRVIEEIPDAQLLSIGDGKIKKDLEALARNLKLEERIIFVPAVSDTSEAFSIMDVFVMPSLQEGLGLSIMEAMRAGVPVVASSVGGITSLIKDNETGILVKPKDPDAIASAIIDLLKNKERASKLSSQAQELILKEFSLEKMAQETEKVYQQCLN